MPHDVGNFILDKAFDVNNPVTKYRAAAWVSGSPGVVAPFAAATDIFAGVCQESVTADEMTKGKGVPLRQEGISPMEAGAAIVEGAAVVLDAAGRAVPSGTAAAGTQIIGRCFLGATALGNRCSVLLNVS